MVLWLIRILASAVALRPGVRSVLDSFSYEIAIE